MSELCHQLSVLSSPKQLAHRFQFMQGHLCFQREEAPLLCTTSSSRGTHPNGTFASDGLYLL